MEVSSARVRLGRVRQAGWQRQSYGLYVPTQPQSSSDQLRAWRAILPPEAALTSLSAAELRGWELPHPIDHPVFVCLPKGVPRPRRVGVLVSRHSEPVPSVLARGLRVASAAETLLAAARHLGELDLVVLGDRALRRGHCTREELVAVARANRRGAPRLRAVIPLMDERSESPWESVLRRLHQAAEIEVEPQHDVEDDHGGFIARVDLRLVGTRRVHEYDGAGHREAEVHDRDLRREARLVQAGWQRVGYTSRHLLTEGASIIAATDALLGRTWDSRRLAAWHALLADSVCTPTGRARLRHRWDRATYARRSPPSSQVVQDDSL